MAESSGYATPDNERNTQRKGRTPMHAVLEYTYEDNYLQTREKYRADHLRAAWEAVERGELLLGGAVGEGPFSGLLIF
ncbi:MAG: hypothetical protein ABWY04_22060, partial [Arthrobacter sp.]